MAIKYTCDGCHTVTEKPAVRGYVKQGHYCETCTIVVDEYLLALKALHEEAATLFKTKFAELKARCKEKLPEGALPDES